MEVPPELKPLACLKGCAERVGEEAIVLFFGGETILVGIGTESGKPPDLAVVVRRGGKRVSLYVASNRLLVGEFAGEKVMELRRVFGEEVLARMFGSYSYEKRVMLSKAVDEIPCLGKEILEAVATRWSEVTKMFLCCREFLDAYLAVRDLDVVTRSLATLIPGSTTRDGAVIIRGRGYDLEVKLDKTVRVHGRDASIVLDFVNFDSRLEELLPKYMRFLNCFAECVGCRETGLGKTVGQALDACAQLVDVVLQRIKELRAVVAYLP